MKKLTKTGVALLVAIVSVTQVMAQEIIDGAFKRETHNDKLPVELSYIREADALFSWNLIRVLDLKQKQNLPLAYPKSRLIDVLLTSIKSGELDGYLFTNDNLSAENQITADKILANFEGVDTFWVTDPVTLESKQEISKRIFNPDDIVKYRIKEEWVFDKQRSTMMVRIVAIAPITKLRSEGIEIDELPMCWIYYPAIRGLLSEGEVFNWRNSANKLSFDDFFIKRLFSSYIYKEDNVYDERIQDRFTGKAALVESERIKTRLSDFEQALWEY